MAEAIEQSTLSLSNLYALELQGGFGERLPPWHFPTAVSVVGSKPSVSAKWLTEVSESSA